MLDCCRRNKIKSSQISQFLIKMFFFFFLERYVERDIRWSAHPPQKISKPSLFFNFFINQTFLVSICAENTANLQNRAGREFFGGVQPVQYMHKSQYTERAILPVHMIQCRIYHIRSPRIQNYRSLEGLTTFLKQCICSPGVNNLFETVYS